MTTTRSKTTVRKTSIIGLARTLFPVDTRNSSVNRKQCAGIIFGTPGTMYLRYMQSGGIAECLLSFLSALECPIIHDVR